MFRLDLNDSVMVNFTPDYRIHPGKNGIILGFDMDHTLVEPTFRGSERSRETKRVFASKTDPSAWQWKKYGSSGSKSFRSEVYGSSGSSETARDILIKLYKLGYSMFIISNQKGATSHKQVLADKLVQMFESLGFVIPIICCLESGRYRKPSPFLIDYLLFPEARFYTNILSSSFFSFIYGGTDYEKDKIYYIGDAAGRGIGNSILRPTEKDFSATDRKFAANCGGLKFLTDEEFFLGFAKSESNRFQLDDFIDRQIWIKDEEILYFEIPVCQKTNDLNFLLAIQDLIMKYPRIIFINIGIQGSGKTTFAKFLSNFFVFSDSDEKAIKRISRDEYGTKWKKVFMNEVNSTKSNERKYIIVDATHPSVASREDIFHHDFVRIAIYFDIGNMLEEHNLLARKILQDDSLMHSNREKTGISIGRANFRRSFQEPTISEGFIEILTIKRTLNLDREEYNVSNLGFFLTEKYINQCYLLAD